MSGDRTVTGEGVRATGWCVVSAIGGRCFVGFIQTRLESGLIQHRWESARVGSKVQVDEARAALQMRFLVLAPRRVDALQVALHAAPADQLARRELQRLGHQLHGTAATVGFGDLGLLGGVVERAAAASPYGDEHHARAAAAVEFIGKYLTRARCELAPISLADDPRFVTLLADVR